MTEHDAGIHVSVVIPALDEAARLGACLSAVAEAEAHAVRSGSGVTVDVVVVDGGSVDGTPALVAAPARLVRSPRGRAVQMNAGARATSGDVLLFLHADSLLPAGAFVAVGRALAEPDVVGGTFRLRFDRDAPLLRLYALCTRFRWRLFHYGDQGIVVRRTVFDALHGFREMPLMEDVDLLARLARAGRTTLFPLAVTTSSRRFDRHGVVRQQLRNAALVLLYSVGVPAARLARWYEHVSR